MVDIQNRFFQLIILKQLLVKLFDKKKAKPILIEKNCLQRWPRGNSLNKDVSEDQANFKSSYIKAFHDFFVNIVPNMRISTAHLIVMMLISS